MNWYSDSDIFQFPQVAFLVEKRGFPAFRTTKRRLKPEIEAFVTNVFFIILDSKNIIVEHKLRVANYDCDLSAVGLFQRIVNTLA